MTDIEISDAVEIGMDWNDAVFGIIHGFCSATDFSEIAYRGLTGQSQDADDVIRLYVEKDEADKLAIVEEVARRKQTPANDLPSRKWAFLRLQRICREHSGDSKQILDEVEVLYVSLGYPPRLAPFIRYMPTTRDQIKDGKCGEEFMVESLASFLSSERQALARIHRETNPNET